MLVIKMPELPEVETVKRGLEEALLGETFTSVKLNRSGLRVPFPKNFQTLVSNRKIEKISRRAKYILIHLSDQSLLVIHLGMSGHVLLISDKVEYKPSKHDHLVFEFGNNKIMVFNDPRRFGMVFLLKENELLLHPFFRNLGPEPLQEGFSGNVLYEKCKNKKQNLKAALLDQRVVAGLGNIYVSEILFLANISPLRSAGSLSLSEWDLVVRSIRSVLKKAIASGGSSLKDYRKADGELGYFQHSFSVYGREGERCPGCDCDFEKMGGIKRITQAGRSTFFCKEKQE
jgi:formamidopyrimidine-DNA glycosylase